MGSVAVRWVGAVARVVGSVGGEVGAVGARRGGWVFLRHLQGGGGWRGA